MAQEALRQKRNCRSFLSRCFLIAVALLTAPPLIFAEILQNLHYGYDDAGNVARIGDQITLPNTQTLTYDDLDRLLTANGPYGAGGANSTFTYAYNEIGNMTINPQVGAYIYPAGGPTTARPHAATTAGPYPITYDNNGNVLTMTDPTGFFGYNATYNTDNRLSSVTTTFASVPTTSTFVYDGDGGRVKKIVGTTTTRYIGKLYECETTGANTSCSRFIWAGDTRIATVAVTSGTVHYWHGDHLGSSSMITDNTGSKVQALSYYPYGDIRVNQSSTTPPVDVHYKYTGKELDSSSNLYFYESRYYHAVFGRFVSPDSIVPDLLDPQSLNRYTYANNNPFFYTDPNGHCPICFVILLGVVAGTLSAGIQSDWDPFATILGAYMGGYSAGTFYGVFGPATAAFGSLGLSPVSSGIAGGAIAGAVAGGTSGALAMAAGYKVNIGLAIASGAAAGAIGGGAYGWGLGTNLGGELAAALASPAAGASAAAINGSDPGIGALIAASTAAFSLGVHEAYKAYQQYGQNASSQPQGLDAGQTRKSFASPAADPGGVSGGCYGNCRGVSAFWQARPDTLRGGPYDPYNFNVAVSNPQGARLDVVLGTPYRTDFLSTFTAKAFQIFGINLSLNYRSDLYIQVYGENNYQVGVYDLPFEYGKTTPLPYK